MEFTEFFPTGGIGRGIVDPMDVAAFKSRAVANAIMPDRGDRAYRTILTDPACAGRWDTDDVLGVTPKDRGRDCGHCQNHPYGFDRDCEDCQAIRTYNDRRFTQQRVAPIAHTDPAVRDAMFVRQTETQTHYETETTRVMEAATMLARFSRECYAKLAATDAEYGADHVGWRESLLNSAETFASEASALGWPLDGLGRPLAPCDEETGP